MANHTQFDESSSGNTTNDASKPTVKPLELNHAITYGAEETGEAGDGVTTRWFCHICASLWLTQKLRLNQAGLKFLVRLRYHPFEMNRQGFKKLFPLSHNPKINPFKPDPRPLLLMRQIRQQHQQNSKSSRNSISPPSGPGQMSKNNNFERQNGKQVNSYIKLLSVVQSFNSGSIDQKKEKERSH
ncbi:hypothetical protein PPACK8108_LOCUS1350 [Phakopsora pachyrhizi]|uniref:Uncharacterized protein n=1 Tax=Phakopsora pachyrhizi TaxID=170000 RepID=A0AAV0AIR2_PHAPC|nr:hypothetical protein PPACK8108_LOCUS1350 [Phakopsora pachyrhizi]